MAVEKIVREVRPPVIDEEFYTHARHDVRSPLTAILGFSESMGEGIFGPLGHEKYTEYVSAIHQSGQGLAHTFTAIMAILSLNADAITLSDDALSAEQIMQELESNWSDRASDWGVALTFEPGADLPPLTADRRRLAQALDCIVENALNYTGTGTGGRVTQATVKEQLLYELGDPNAYLTPDCSADFTSIQLRDDGPDRVAVEGIRGEPRPPILKTSITYSAGFKAIGSLVFSWPDAREKAEAADRIVRQRVAALGLEFDEIYTEYLGINACHGAIAPEIADPAEVQLRIGVRGPDREAVDRFTRELIPLVLTGPPTGTGFGDGRPRTQAVVAYWSSLLPREEIEPKVDVYEIP